MKLIAGGLEYPLATLKWSDVRDLRAGGWMKRLARIQEIDASERDDTVAEIVATSIRRAGVQVSARELMDATDYNLEMEGVFLGALNEILSASGFMAQEGGSPNGGSPGTPT